jgi:hypothetical protein
MAGTTGLEPATSAVTEWYILGNQGLTGIFRSPKGAQRSVRSTPDTPVVLSFVLLSALAGVDLNYN